jgi:hypothetical protein
MAKLTSTDIYGSLLVQGTLNTGTLTTTGAFVAPLGTALLPSYTFTGDLNTGIWSSGADTLNISTAGAERLRVTSTGDIGIGTTSPINKLHLHSTGTSSNMSFTTTVSGVTGNDGLIVGHQDDSNIFWGKENLPTRFATNNTEKMRINANGNVGIGTDNPGRLLDVNGVSRFRNIAYFGPTEERGYISWDAVGLQFVARSNQALSLGSNNAIRLSITSGGDVGIGTTSPAQKLDVVGNARVSGQYQYGANAYTEYNATDKSIDFVFTD